MKKNIKYCTIIDLRKIILFFALSLIVYACAKIGYPSGGPKDVTPPKVIESTPTMNSTDYKGEKIEIDFDEFIQLIDVSKNFVVSPPMKKKPRAIIRGKKVIVELEEDLKANTTYRFYFGNSIADINQSNVLQNFEFVFSTGDVIDSLSLKGRLLNAFDLAPDKESFYIMLYKNSQDSVPRKQLPVYITKTNEKGWFSITHIRPDTFMIFALKDLNQNMLFDIPNESIAFADTLIHIDKSYYLPDSLDKADTSSIDTINRAPFLSRIQLYSFSESHEKQYLKKFERNTPEKIDLIFGVPIYDSVHFEPLNFAKKNCFVPDCSLKNDTMTYWISDTSVVYKDTLRLKVTYIITDSLERFVPRTDTISLAIKKTAAQKKKKTQVGITPFKINSSTETQSIVDLNKRVVLTPALPLASMDLTKMRLIKNQDNKKTNIKFTLEHDSNYLRRYYLSFKPEPQTDYQFIADSASFKSIYSQTSDSTGYGFRMQKDDYYGRIKLTLKNITGQVIIQLFTGKDEVVQQKIIEKDQVIVFDYLKFPIEYSLKAIFDTNRNKIWDTGDFKKKLQPEKVLFFSKKIPIRSNWDDEETWELK